MKFLRENFLSLIIIILVIIIVLSRNNGGGETPDPIIVKDTVYITKIDTVHSAPTTIETIEVPIETITKEIQYVPDTNYDKLQTQYLNLLSRYFEKNIVKDTLKLDSLGYIHITDTVTRNFISDRTYTYDIKLPYITETITNSPVTRNQLYIGGSISGNPSTLVNQFNVGLMWKTKNDKLFGVYTGMNISGTVQYGVQSYWKIKLKK